ncbi:hypothetical protein [Vulgatibacter incomptus]|uniref:hypothetical protein n=1 Tax=Vulgatibacter incomptus TaxID=1391653 RepID=UPI0012FA1655|nr:hypothetical protein [Vulgatibacter incomptus]
MKFKVLVGLMLTAAVGLSGCEADDKDKPELERRISEIGATFDGGRFFNVSVTAEETQATCIFAKSTVWTSSGYKAGGYHKTRSMTERAMDIGKTLNMQCRNDDLREKLRDR